MYTGVLYRLDCWILNVNLKIILKKYLMKGRYFYWILTSYWRSFIILDPGKGQSEKCYIYGVLGNPTLQKAAKLQPLHWLKPRIKKKHILSVIGRLMELEHKDWHQLHPPLHQRELSIRKQDIGSDHRYGKCQRSGVNWSGAWYRVILLKVTYTDLRPISRPSICFY